MKKGFAFAAAVCLIAAVGLAACGGGDGQENDTKQAVGASDSEKQPEGGAADGSGREDGADTKQTEISLWTYPVGNWGSQSSVSSILTAFHTEYPQYNVTVKYLDYNTGDSEIEAALENGTAPDLVLEGPERLVANWGSRGKMVDLADLWQSEKAGQIYTEIRAACHDSSGKFYEYPICMTTHCMAINRDMFEAAGALAYIDEETHTWTTENFIKAVKALAEYRQGRVAVVYCGGQGGDQGTRALVNNLYGGTFTNEEHTAYTVNSEENRRALELLAGLDGIEFDPTIVGGDEAVLFANGELAMSFCWNVSMEISQTLNNPNMTFEVFPMAFPTDSGAPRLQGGIWGFGIFENGDPDRVEAAKEFIRYLTEDDARYKRTVQTSSYWPVRDIAGIYTNDEMMTEYGMFMQYMGNYYQVTTGWADVRTAWWKMLQQIGEGADAAEALEELDEAAQAASAAASNG